MYFVVACFTDANRQGECSLTFGLVFRKFCFGILVGTPDILTALFRPFVSIFSKHDMPSELMRASLNMTQINEFSNILSA
jgi:hypothetical protein